MFVYVWKHNETPFYVGMTKAIGRTNPLNAGGRGWLCKQKLEQVGRSNVIVETHTANTLEDAQALEISLIEKYGRVQLGNGPLTNLRAGGDGSAGMTEAGRLATSKRMKENNPVHNLETRAKINKRMQEPDVQKKLRDNNPAKQPEIREKLKAKWQDPTYQEKQKKARTGLKKHTEEHKQTLREKLLDPSNPMREYHKTLNSDPTIKAKRTATLQSAEVRAKISAGLKARWAQRKANI